jgi:RNA polymerase sigma-70 factor (ECF subfamily)
MLKAFPAVRRREAEDDVLQNAVIRLYRALEQTKPESVRHFHRLAALQIRRELIDLAKQHLGPQGHGAEHHTDGGGMAADDPRGSLDAQPGEVASPESVEAWTRFHQAVEVLPEDEREVINLLWYEGLPQEQAAAVLGVSLRTMKRRWQAARMRLAEALGDHPPA